MTLPTRLNTIAVSLESLAGELNERIKSDACDAETCEQMADTVVLLNRARWGLERLAERIGESNEGKV